MQKIRADNKIWKGHRIYTSVCGYSDDVTIDDDDAVRAVLFCPHCDDIRANDDVDACY